jgi:hypothetical protein
MPAIRIKQEMISSEYGTLRKGNVLNMPEDHCRQLVGCGAAEYYETKVIREVPVAGPLDSATSGAPSSSSPAAPAPQMPTSSLPESGPSSSSTTPGALRRGPQRSTPATATGGSSTVPKSSDRSTGNAGRKTRLPRKSSDSDE